MIFAWCGFIVWLLLPLYIPERGIMGEIEHLLRFAIFVLLPLEIELAADRNRRGEFGFAYTWLRMLYVPAALCVALSFVAFPEASIAAALFVLPWLALSLIGALHALRRLVSRGAIPIAEFVFDLGWIYWPVGAIWLVASRLGFELMGFSGKIVVLTAVHFYFAGLAAPLIVGLAGRYLEYGTEPRLDDRADRGPRIARRLYRASALLVAAGIPLTAAGIAASPLLEWGAALAIAVGLSGVMLLVVLRLVPALLFGKATGSASSGIANSAYRRTPLRGVDAQAAGRFARSMAAALLFAAACSVFISMWFAFRFATGEYFGDTAIAGAPVAIDAMVVLHGWWNALGFAGLGIIAFSILRPKMRRFEAGIPFSRLASTEVSTEVSTEASTEASRGRIGKDFFERSQLIDETPARPPTGLVDELSAYDGPEFAAHRLHPTIREFYERTADFELSVAAKWRWFMRPAARLYARISARLEQMNFPTADETQAITSRILAIRDGRDGRQGVRAWVRHYTASGRAIYAAAYASHRLNDRTFMNIAFAAPGGNLTSVLRLSHLTGPGDSGGLALTSRPHGSLPGDEGVYFANRFAPVRLPINETIRVYSREMPGGVSIACAGELVAHHRMWLCGIVFLELEYCIRRRK